MNEGIALRLLVEVMGWDNSTAREEAEWLRLMSDFKYDSYREYLAGSRFIESLAGWLQQFDRAYRGIAYEYVRENLIFVSSPELQHLVERLYPEHVEPVLVAEVAAQLQTPQYLVWRDPRAEAELNRARRRTLFFGLSDGARIDAFRRANEGRISNEQVLVATQISPEKWSDVLEELRVSQGTDAKFDRVFLLDDFIGTGKTLLRRNEEKQTWTGRLVRFRSDVESVSDSHFAAGWKLHVHHYIATRRSTEAVKSSERMARHSLQPAWFNEVSFSFGLVLSELVSLNEARQSAFWALTERYYDAAIETKATRVGGEDVKRGFGGCGLPLVLEHNTPNNSVALLWAETRGGVGVHAMRPLFRRAQRHWGT
jgi:hypothetical protein